jgi:imidazole glycerol-phosphate synthase subunit HisF
MLRPRVTPCLLIRNGGLVKTRQFTDDKYIGDPINAVKIFNEKSVDELIVIDIDATVYGKEPDYKLIEKLANESRMPLCYSGGIKSVGQAEQIIQLGVEKIGLSSAIIERPELIGELSEALGSQSIVGVLDVKKSFLKGYEVYINNGRNKVQGALINWIEKFQEYGVGEILFNSIDRDGMQAGYDLDFATFVHRYLNVPVTYLGGAASLDDIGELVENFGVIGCAAGSLFVFKGKYRAVLINYPPFDEKYLLLTKCLHIYNNNAI